MSHAITHRELEWAGDCARRLAAFLFESRGAEIGDTVTTIRIALNPPEGFDAETDLTGTFGEHDFHNALSRASLARALNGEHICIALEERYSHEVLRDRPGRLLDIAVECDTRGGAVLNPDYGIVVSTAGEGLTLDQRVWISCGVLDFLIMAIDAAARKMLASTRPVSEPGVEIDTSLVQPLRRSPSDPSAAERRHMRALDER